MTGNPGEPSGRAAALAQADSLLEVVAVQEDTAILQRFLDTGYRSSREDFTPAQEQRRSMYMAMVYIMLNEGEAGGVTLFDSMQRSSGITANMTTSMLGQWGFDPVRAIWTPSYRNPEVKSALVPLNRSYAQGVLRQAGAVLDVPPDRWHPLKVSVWDDRQLDELSVSLTVPPPSPLLPLPELRAVEL